MSSLIMKVLPILVIALCSGTLRADDGIWLFNRFPKDRVEKQHGFEVSDAFLDHLRLSSVRMGGASGSFVSPNGLIFTNHHVGRDCVQKLSTAEQDYMANGFYATAESDEQKCPDMTVSVLLRIEDVTAKVNADVPPDTPAAEANQQRKASTARIEKECSDSSQNLCEVVTLYSGGLYHLYEYKKYTDLRLVFAPDGDIAFFGGDPDNFTYPRYDLDITFLRAYEDGRPASTPNYLNFSREGVQEGELTFASGHPGATGRLLTMAQLEFSRDVSYPMVLKRLGSLIDTLQAYGALSDENRRIAGDNLFGQQNSFKAYTGFMAGLRDEELMNRKRKEERDLRDGLAKDAKTSQEYGKVWDEVAAAYAEYRNFFSSYWLIESVATRGSDLLGIARHALRLPEEKEKPNEERLEEYRDTALPRLEQVLYSPAPLYDSMEIAVLADYFSFLRDELGAEDATMKAILGDKTPAEAAEEYVTTSKLKDVSERKRVAASVEAARNSQDGMMRLARILDDPARKLRKRYEDRVEAVVTDSQTKIARARFALYGTDMYPDATSTLRMSYGPAVGYRNTSGKDIPYATTFEGLYSRATGVFPYRLQERWLKAKDSLDMSTPLNFVTTCDTHGGNSGSPTVNTKGEIVGILFDGNIESLPNRFVYTEAQSRSVHVASQGIIEALRKVYNADRVVKELGLEEE